VRTLGGGEKEMMRHNEKGAKRFLLSLSGSEVRRDTISPGIANGEGQDAGETVVEKDLKSLFAKGESGNLYCSPGLAKEEQGVTLRVIRL